MEVDEAEDDYDDADELASATESNTRKNLSSMSIQVGVNFKMRCATCGFHMTNAGMCSYVFFSRT